MDAVTFNVPTVNRAHIAFRRAELHVAQGVHRQCVDDGVPSDIHRALNFVRGHSKDIERVVLTNFRRFALNGDSLKNWFEYAEERRQMFAQNFVQIGANLRSVERYLDMFPLLSLVKKYSPEWFARRAMNSVRRISKKVWDYSDSLLLYMPSGVHEYEAVQDTDTLYHDLVTKPEREYLAQVASMVVANLPDHFEYIDLGPGTDHKEQFFFDACKAQGKTFTYVPVDISDYFLDSAAAYAQAQGIQVRKMKASFEELPYLLGSVKVPRFVSLGLMFANYHPFEIISLLEDIAGKGGKVFINARIKERVDTDTLQGVYQGVVDKGFCKDKLKLLGLTVGEYVTSPTVDQNNCTWCTVLKQSPQLAELGVQEGDSLLIFQSLLYLKEELSDIFIDSGNRWSTYSSPTSIFMGALMG